METIQLTEVGSIESEDQGPFAPESLPDLRSARVYSRCWRGQRSDGNWVIITYSAAPTPIEGERNEYDIQDCTEIMLARDEDGEQEIDTDYAWDYPNYLAIHGIRKANQEAKRYVKLIGTEMFQIADSATRSVRING